MCCFQKPILDTLENTLFDRPVHLPEQDLLHGWGRQNAATRYQQTNRPQVVDLKM